MREAKQVSDDEKIGCISFPLDDTELILHARREFWRIGHSPSPYSTKDHTPKLLVVALAVCRLVVRKHPLAERERKVAGFRDFGCV